jgi:hypothetical protein
MEKIKNKPNGLLTAKEAREAGVQISDKKKQAIGFKRDKKNPTEFNIVLPYNFVIDRFTFVNIDIEHVAYKKKVH